MLESLLNIDCLEPTLLCDLKALLLSKDEIKQLNQINLETIFDENESCNPVKKKMEDSICQLVVLSSSFKIYGWGENGEREPHWIIGANISAIDFEKNIVITQDQDIYYNCLILRDDVYLSEDDRGYLNIREGILHWEKRPLFFWHQAPLLEWYKEKPRANPGLEKNVAELSKREISKRNTAERNDDLYKTYCQMKLEHPGKSDQWIANQIAKTPFGQSLEMTPGRIRRIISDKRSGNAK